MKKLIRLTESDLHRIVKESVQRILKETRLDYDDDNFSGRYSRNADNTIPYQGKLFAFDVDDRGKIYKYGQLKRSSCWPGGTEGQYEDRVVRQEDISMGINPALDYLSMPSSVEIKAGAATAN